MRRLRHFGVHGYLGATAVGDAMTIATLDTASFEVAGLKAVDPWAGQKMAGGRMDAHRG